MYLLTEDDDGNKQDFDHVSSFYQRGDVLELNLRGPDGDDYGEQDLPGHTVLLCEEDHEPETDEIQEGDRLQLLIGQTVDSRYSEVELNVQVANVFPSGSMEVDSVSGLTYYYDRERDNLVYVVDGTRHIVDVLDCEKVK